MNDPTPTAKEPCIAEGLCFALYSSAHAMMKAYAPNLKRIGLTYSQFLVLFALWEKDGRTVSDLGTTLFLDSGTLTPLLKRMEQGGYLKRARCCEDERQVRITLTEKGRELRAQGLATARQFYAATGKSAAQLAPLQRELTEIRDRLLAQLKPDSE